MNVNAEIAERELRRLCHRCVGEPYLRDIIQTRGDDKGCSYCGAETKTFSIFEAADLIEAAFEQHYVQTAEDDRGRRDGDEVVVVIAEAAQIDDEPAEDIRKVLHDRTSSPPDEAWDEDPFSKTAQYTANDPDDALYLQEWFQFERSLKTEARFFSSTAFATLKNVFAGLDDHRTSNGDPVIVKAGPTEALRSLFRARVFQTEAKLKDALIAPDKRIGPPESSLATAGRMNARGISVFYGAKEAKTALAELRPPVGSDVVIGRFEIIKDVRLLDVSALATTKADGSIFDPTFIKRLERAKFLRSLSRRISRPILPDDELSEYLVTQAIADFLATELRLDGVIYRSAQAKDGTNVALFHHASRIAPYDLPAGSKVSAHTDEVDEDSVYRCFTVFEEVPPHEAPKPAGEKTVPPPDFFTWGMPEQPVPDPFLKLDLASIIVREVQAVDYSWEEYQVTRLRSERASRSDS